MSEPETPNEAGSVPEPTPRARRALTISLSAGALLLVVAGVVLRTTAPEPEPLASSKVMGVTVEVMTVGAAPLQHRVQVSGMVQARRSVGLFAEQAGRVLEVNAEALDRVEAGQVLLRVDPLPGEVEVARAEATLAQAESELALARTDLERMQKLATNRVSSESDLDRAHNKQQVAIAVERAAEASLRSARDHLAQRTLAAPFEGVLRSFEAEEGEYVSPGEKIGELLEVSSVRVEVGLRDRDVVAITPGMQADIEVDARPGESFTGVVTRVAGAADSATRKFPVQIEMENAEGLVLPGMVALIDLQLGHRSDAITVPHDVVLREFALAFVYVVSPSPDGDTTARRRRITTRAIPFQPGALEVTSGLEAGERIAMTGLRQLQDGTAVEVRPRLGVRTEPH